MRKQKYGFSRLVVCASATLIVAFASPVQAVDGVIEINQACAVNTGCFGGDAAGFPVTISQPGSYRLTSNLTLAVSANAIGASPIDVPDVTIDLNGFTIDGGGALNNGIQLFSGDNWEIRNGTVTGFATGIQQGLASTGHRIIGVRVFGNTSRGIQMSNTGGHLVQDCTVIGNVGIGISVAVNSRVVGNTVTNNTGFGMSLGAGTGYSDNVVNSNTGGTVGGGGVEMGANVCNGNTTCP